MKKSVFILLYPLYLVYLLIGTIRNLFYDFGIFKSKKLDSIVVSIGNISMGGTGKTPLVIALAKALQNTHKVAILSRGYKRDSSGTLLVTNGNYKPENWRDVGDEPYLMAQHLKNVPIVVDEDRVRGGEYIINRFNPDIILLDDAFQHRRLHRDTDIVLIDASQKEVFLWWREPKRALKRANLILLTKTTDERYLGNWYKSISKIDIPAYSVNSEVSTSLLGVNGNRLALEQISGKNVITFSGIANSESFNSTVLELGCNILDTLSFKDHHRYVDIDIEKIRSKYLNSKPEYILTTEKDLLKLPGTKMPIWAVPIEMKLSKEIIGSIENILRTK